MDTKMDAVDRKLQEEMQYVPYQPVQETHAPWKGLSRRAKFWLITLVAISVHLVGGTIGWHLGEATTPTTQLSTSGSGLARAAEFDWYAVSPRLPSACVCMA